MQHERTPGWILALSILVVAGWLVGSPEPASAISFDRRGAATLDAAYTEGFEQDLGSDRYVAPGDLTYTTGPSLEGARAVIVGEERNKLYLQFPSAEFEGRRVNVRLWYRARGTDVSPRLIWSHNSFSTHSAASMVTLGNATLHRTGRATTDGWVEMATGPIDWEYAEAGGPVALVLADTQYRRRRPLGQNDDATVLVDALEIEDLGEAAVAPRDCSLIDEGSQCGADGVCVLGKCADAAAALGTLPRGEMREDYLQRRAFLADTLLAVRETRSQLTAFKSELLSLVDVSTKRAWSGIVEAWELLRDGHGSPPSNRGLRIQNLGGTCLGPGRADLLEPGPQAPVPMVFEARDERLEPGDVITAIDGLSVDEWKKRASRYLYYNGDPRGREALQVNEVLRAAILTGATVEFTRCARSESNRETPCGPSERETITIDYGDDLGGRVWSGENISLYFRDQNFCDFRFDRLRPNSDGIGRASAFFTQTDDGFVRAEYYNMPSPGRGGNGPFQSWKSEWDEAMADQPDGVVVDQRLGFGGSFAATMYLGDLFMNDSTTIYDAGFPWYGTELSDEMMKGLRRCTADNRDSECGGPFFHQVQSFFGTELGADSKLAVLSASSVSGHDFWAKYLTFREAPTRFFGYSPTMGAFGEARRFAPLPGEVTAPRYQFHDTQFYNDEQGIGGARFTSGRGVGPDVATYQRQSDALAGVDTALEAAKAWLRSSN